MFSSKSRRKNNEDNISNSNNDKNNIIINQVEVFCDNIEEDNDDNKIMSNAYKAFEIFFNMINNISDNTFDGFLISSESISNFLEIIKESEILNNNIFYKRKIYERKIKNILITYKTEMITILYDFNECKNILENSKDNKIKNEFIIVDYKFLYNLDVKNIENKFYVFIDKKKMQITFSEEKKLSFKKIEKRIYKFIPDKDNLYINLEEELKKIPNKEIELYSFIDRKDRESFLISKKIEEDKKKNKTS